MSEQRHINMTRAMLNELFSKTKSFEGSLIWRYLACDSFLYASGVT